MPNRLSQETSPYLLQHANNPVDWFPWGAEALEKAKAENKLILVSIGYSACHWCHVMEHESFEDNGVAEIMNRFFVCIKIDREERPDIDQIYMTAVQLMTNSGGWPLNCICLPDQRPIYGGTYFRKEDWKNVLLNLAELWKNKPDEAEDYAEKLTGGIRESEKLDLVTTETEFSGKQLKDITDPWKRRFDMSEGGYNQAPKFPLPNNWLFLLRYGYLMKDESALMAVRQTLEKMAFGGIYDHIGGGFARYSVDARWHVPHFEKMLYDNAQLISLYAEAYQCFNDELYKKVVYQTIEWAKREMTSPETGFYSALDADSEGVEGKFYTFSKEEIRNILGDDEELFSIYFNVIEEGNWEEEQTNIFLKKYTDSQLAEQLGIDELTLVDKIEIAKKRIFDYREKRIRPGLDNKILASWNGIMIKALIDAYRVFDDAEFLNIAKKNAGFILNHIQNNNGVLQRVLNSKTSTNGFLDDYAFFIEALIGLYEATFDESWLKKARLFCDDVIKDFYDGESKLFFYTSSKSEGLIARKQEIMDNVIPASNSVMAANLYKLGNLFADEEYLSIARQQLRTVQPHMKKYGSAYSNWAVLLLNEVVGIYEIAITGPDFDIRRTEMEKNYIPNKIMLGGKTGTLPLLEGKLGNKTKIFICKNRSCKLPVEQVNEALTQLV